MKLSVISVQSSAKATAYSGLKKKLTADGCKLIAEQGFFLMEALILVLVISLTFVAFMGVIAQALKISVRDQELLEGISKYEELLFELENGLRPDLLLFGGRGKEGAYHYEIKSENEKDRDSYGHFKSRLAWKKDREFLDFDFFVSRGALE